MKNKLLFVLYTLVVFGFGGLLTFMVMTKVHMQALETLHQKPQHQTSQTDQSVTRSVTSSATDVAVNDVLAKPKAIEQVIANQKQNKTNFFTHDFNEQAAKAVLNSISDRQLNHYVERFMSASDAVLIGDKRQFANRAIEELYKQNDNQPLTGQILLAPTSDFPDASMNTHTIQKRQKLYAHLNTFGKIPLGANVFIKWTNRTTGEVLLFEKKPISEHATTNWVSYQPYDTWQTGTYDVRFYQFTSRLEPVAQFSYEIYQVSE
ncbi:hypothetical protein MOMA_05220 [Moraxella macacae 0408225]|uniref:Uncharacterized protein n=1 Tax=Moraxella macacae 0408225 TaxID=1230338 RepID=L2FAI6_9GAMM|nr:hypothetical protein [Moraxella macacae]ELA09776.1 hypothetical protein MOMA_05220 [Moraxella macacae 0408225]